MRHRDVGREQVALAARIRPEIAQGQNVKGQNVKVVYAAEAFTFDVGPSALATSARTIKYPPLVRC